MDTNTPAAAPTPLPTLSPPDAELLNTFLNANLSLPALSTITGQCLAQVIAWRNKPAIDAYITLYLKYKAQADDLADRADHAAAMSTLRALLTAPNPIEQRRAATTMLRALAQRSRPKPRDKPIDNPIDKPIDKPVDKRIEASRNMPHAKPHDKANAHAAAHPAHSTVANSPAPSMPLTYNPLLPPLSAAAHPVPTSTTSKRPNPAALIAAALAPTG